MTSRLAGILKPATQQILVAAPPDDSPIDGYVGLERRMTLHRDEHVEITDLVVDAAARRSGHGRALVTAYAAADFVICRSGAMTCAELAAVGLPAAYVPLPLRGGEPPHKDHGRPRRRLALTIPLGAVRQFRCSPSAPVRVARRVVAP